MGQLIAYCGLDCSTCEAYIHTQENNTSALEQLLEKWRVEFNLPNMEMKDLICDGCSSDERMGGYCAVCVTRACARQRQLNTCAECPDYLCEQLANFIQNTPAAKANLDALRKN